MQWTFGDGELVFQHKPPATIVFAKWRATHPGSLGPCVDHMVVSEGNTILVLGRVLEQPGMVLGIR
ncbi:hypothetical protein RISK_000329 [Rhodopirellula islandica]|uniref:Uncharacterized protein n=1 Tax=Rhodopirellula islandica TaxID=595434 RepID=A0A0J1BME7_RHOIS|nr:hypothetical protein RISK_000329 [Rhodopirellula islandica]